MKTRTIHLKQGEVVQLAVEGVPHVLVMLSEAGDWLNVETRDPVIPIRDDATAEHAIYRALADEEAMNPIKTYTVRRPGCTAWSDGHKTLREALAERDRAEQVEQGHQVYAMHANGAVSGPYPRDDWEGEA